MELLNNQIGLVDEILQDFDVSAEQRQTLKEKIEIEFRRRDHRTMIALKIIFSISIVVFFVASYLFSYYFIDRIVSLETDLISKKLMNPDARSINSLTVSALIAATVTQTGLAFYAVTTHLFGSKSGTEKS